MDLDVSTRPTGLNAAAADAARVAAVRHTLHPTLESRSRRARQRVPRLPLQLRVSAAVVDGSGRGMRARAGRRQQQVRSQPTVHCLRAEQPFVSQKNDSIRLRVYVPTALVCMVTVEYACFYASIRTRTQYVFDPAHWKNRPDWVFGSSMWM